MKILILAIISFLAVNVHAANFEIISYNVENLFDTKHDQGKNDWAFLPKKTKGKKENCSKISYPKYRKSCFAINWTDKHLNVKLNQIKKVITYKRDKLPNVLILSEIENENVVGMLAKKLGFSKWIVSNGPDKRGIDLAILFNPDKNFNLVASKEHILEGEYFLKKPTRPILEAEFKFNGQLITIFANHWPSLGNPTEVRLIAAKKLRERSEEILRNNKKQLIVAAGDFNTIPENHPHPFKDELLKTGKLVGVHERYMKSKSVKKNRKYQMPPGTFFFGRNMTWNLLDRFFVSENLVDRKGPELDLASYQIMNHRFISKDFKFTRKGNFLRGSLMKRAPWSYEHKALKAKRAGYSDHFPIRMEIKNI